VRQTRAATDWWLAFELSEAAFRVAYMLSQFGSVHLNKVGF